MIEWIKYDPYSREIESHVTHLVTNGTEVTLAQRAKVLGGEGYEWHLNGGYRFKGVTHWAKINMPESKYACTGCWKDIRSCECGGTGDE